MQSNKKRLLALDVKERIANDLKSNKKESLMQAYQKYLDYSYKSLDLDSYQFFNYALSVLRSEF